MIKIYISSFLIGLLIGIFSFLFIMDRGGKVEIGFEYPWVKIDFVGAPHQIPINFGENPSEWTLGKALEVIEDRTQGRGSARVFVDKNVLSGQFASRTVKPPAGYQPSLQVIKQLLVDASASNNIQICLVPEGGYRICER